MSRTASSHEFCEDVRLPEGDSDCKICACVQPSGTIPMWGRLTILAPQKGEMGCHRKVGAREQESSLKSTLGRGMHYPGELMQWGRECVSDSRDMDRGYILSTLQRAHTFCWVWRVLKHEEVCRFTSRLSPRGWSCGVHLFSPQSLMPDLACTGARYTVDGLVNYGVF